MQVPVLTRPDGQKSTTFTMVIVGFGVVTLWLLVSILEKIGPLQIRPFDSAHAMAYFVPVLTAYLGRRQQESSETKAEIAATAQASAAPAVAVAVPAEPAATTTVVTATTVSAQEAD